MYGMVNKAVQDMAVSKFGEATWNQIKQKAGLDVDMFVSMDTYDDKITYSLVGAASEVLGLTGSQVLEAFGEHWTSYTAKEGYGDLLKMSGRTLPEFLMNLDNMHARIALTFPDLKPPSFSVSDVTATSLRLHYHSERAGLAPLVLGLLRGLGTMFNIKVQVEHDKKVGEGASHDEFKVSFTA